MNENIAARYVIALYIRLSMEDRKSQSMSIENQRNALHHFVEGMEQDRNIETLEYVDNGFSGTNFERPAVQALLNDVQEGKIDCIIVKDFSRFGRSSVETGYFMEMVFPLYNVRFISINDGFDSNELHGETGGVNSAFKYLAAEFYSRDLSAKIRSSQGAKFRRGEYQSEICPYGYQKGPNGRLEPDEETAPVVRMIFEMAINGKNTREIAEELFRRKIPTPGEYKAAKGQPYYDISRNCGLWGSSFLCRILSDERYIGTYIMGKREVTKIGGGRRRLKDEADWIKIPDHHPAIVSKEVYAEVQARRRGGRRVMKDVLQYPLRGRVFCGGCGHSLFRTDAKHPSFLCKHTRPDKNAPCHGMKIREADLEKLVYDAIIQQTQILNLDSSLDTERLTDRLTVQIAKRTECEQRIERCMERKRMLYEELISGRIGLEDYNAQKAGVDIALSHWKNACAALVSQIEQERMNNAARSDWLKAARESMDVNGLTAEAVERLIERVEVYPDGRIEVVWRLL